MTKKFLASTSLLIALAAGPAMAQTATPMTPPASPAMSGTAITAPTANTWRSSKLIGVDVYNNSDEKIGDISELILDSSGKIDTVVIGVGGFLGLGQSDVAVKYDQIKFVNEPRTSRTASSTSMSPTGSNTTSGSGTTSGAGTMSGGSTTSGGAMNNRPAGSTVGATSTSSESRMYPDHAVLNVTKEQLKAMPQFKYSQDTSGTSTTNR